MLKKSLLLFLIITSIYSCSDLDSVNTPKTQDNKPNFIPLPSVDGTPTPNPNSSSSTQPIRDPVENTITPNGVPFSDDLFKEYAPSGVSIGTMWTYSIKNSISSTEASDITIEVINILGEEKTLKTTSIVAGKPISSERKTAIIGKPIESKDAIELFFTGIEDIVVVPAGTYRLCAKGEGLSKDKKTKITLWLAKNIGVVKTVSEISTQGSDKLITSVVLKEFKN